MEFVNVCTKSAVSLFNKNQNDGLSYSVIYNLCKEVCDGKTKYGIQIISGRTGKEASEIMGDISEDKELVEKMIFYLSQNAVEEVSFRDVIHDLLVDIEDQEVNSSL